LTGITIYKHKNENVMNESYGKLLRKDVVANGPVAFIGVYDTFSASIAARHFDGLFISGYSFAASYYGLPDTGFIAWSDIVAFTQRVRTLLPQPHILVDIDDGYCDTEVACHVVRLLENLGASAVVIEDQQRPRRCGHLDGKRIMELNAFLSKLRGVLDTRRELVIVARTDAIDEPEILRRVAAFTATGADAILVDGIRDMGLLQKVRRQTNLPLMYNQIAGGKSLLCTLSELRSAGVSLLNYSTPCLFAAQAAIEAAMILLKAGDGGLDDAGPDGVNLEACSAFLMGNLAFHEQALPQTRHKHSMG
jgi:2-methylisocitrate lyase-like PEP mutase family enzyme